MTAENFFGEMKIKQVSVVAYIGCFFLLEINIDTIPI